MKVVIWGAGSGCKKALSVCKALKWEIVAIIDSDPQKKGKSIEEMVIQDTAMLKHIDKDTYIVIANTCSEVYYLAQKYTSLIIDWNTLSILYNGAARNPNYETRDLQEENIKNCKLLKDRKALLTKLSEHYQRKVTFAEVGVAFGDFSKEIIKRCTLDKFYLIDAWEGQRYSEGLKAVKDSFQNEINDGLVEIRSGFSIFILLNFDNASIDIAYIDTSHTYETTWEELLICRSKVKQDGFICGHDYTRYNSYSRTDYGVYDAVNRFCVEYDYEICYLTMERDGLHSFAIKKII